jgi:hypothetical protein
MDNDLVGSGLPYLADLRLTFLSMSGSAPKPQELLSLTKLHSLETLRLDKDDVDEKTLLTLAKLPHLKELSVRKSSISQSTIDKFHSINSQCKLNYDEDLVENSHTN